MDSLFSNTDSHSVRENEKRKMLAEIDRLTEAQVMNTSLEQWADHFADKFTVDLLTLDEANISSDINDVQVDARNLRDRNNFHFDDDYGPRKISGSEIVFYVPFTGDENLFHVQPSSFTFNRPRAEIGQGELIFRYTYGAADAHAARQAFNGDLANVRQYVNSLRNDFSAFNTELKGVAQSRLQQRFSKLQKDQEAAAALGFPIRKRGNPTQTYVVPTVKRKITPRPQPSGQIAAKSEPALAMDEYEHILGITRSMVTLIEQSPHAFRGMDEETLRTQFLLPLNAQYEGQATGETFNFQGKTDIIIKDGSKNIFVAECKFWRGAAGFTETIDQLLGYLSWRDTKTAILLFNRNKNLSNVLAQIPGLVKAHPNYLREWKPSGNETEFRYILHHKDDRARELFLTVQVYEVPT